MSKRAAPKRKTAAEKAESEPLLQEVGDWQEAEHEGLLPPARRRLLSPLPLALLAVLIAALGFIGGVLVQKGSTGSGGGALPSGLSRLQGRGGAGASPFGGAGAPTLGTVTDIRGKALYITDPQGNTVKVVIPAGSTVTRSAKAKASQIHPGDSVVVQGAKKKDGTIHASSVSASSGGSGPGALLSGGGPGTLSTGASGGGGSTSGGGGPVNQLFGK